MSATAQMMNGEWLDRRPKGWPRSGWDKRKAALGFGLLMMFVISVGRGMLPLPEEMGGLNALQRFYLPQYVANVVRPGDKIPVLFFVDRQGNATAAVRPEDVVPTRAARPLSVPLSPAPGSRSAKAAAGVRYEQVARGRAEAFVRSAIYEGRTLSDIFKPGIYLGLGVMLFGLVLATPQDRKRQAVLANGRRVRGPESPDRYEFNKKRGRNYGIGWKLDNPMNLIERFYYRPPLNDVLMIPEQDLAQQFLLMGDTGTGKSALIRQMLVRIEERGETAIVYDPAQEYVKRFYRAERGDVILNPLDERSPYWSPGEEIEHEAEAQTIAESAFPERPNESPFFTQTPRKIFAHMLRYRMNAAQMLEAMRDGAALDRLVAGTELASSISTSAPAQREGVRASLNLIAESLKLLKAEGQAKSKWTAREWAQKKQGWIFVTSTPETRTALQPLISLWLDMLVLRLMNPDRPETRRVWFVLDEVATLKKMPQLATALAENRKSNNPIVIGIQGKAQLETIYGHIAEMMLSQARTKIFLRTSEPHAAKWVSEAIGEVELERFKTSRSFGYQSAAKGRRETKTYYAPESRTGPLVMAAQISGLENLRGYLKNGNDVVPMVIPYLELPEKAPGFVARKTEGPGPLPPILPKEGPKNGPTPKLQAQQHEQKRQREQERHFFE